jgi:ectoine hydroxylase-related dioxygenase (phytanoyl-CoA dioxygenase family)
MGHELTADEARAYREQGYFVRERVLDARDLAELRGAVERIHRRIVAESRAGEAPIERVDGLRYQTLQGSRIKWEWREDAQQIRSMEPVHHLDARIAALIDDPRLVRPAAGLLGRDDLSLFTDKLNFKRPAGSPFPWHQDAPYWAFGCAHLDELVSLQLYLDDANERNGCLWMIPSSHRSGVLPTYQDRGVLGRLYTDVEQHGGAPPVPLVAPAGSVIYFDGYVVHGSRGNRSRASRRAMVITYQAGQRPRWNHEDMRPIPGG